MCGRFTREMTWAEVVAFTRGLDLIVPETEPEPSWNVCPTQDSPVLMPQKEGEGAVVKNLRWGLLPPWAKDPKIGASMINARYETVAEKPAFRKAWQSRRCLVPASGYYEWRLEHGVKQPYFIHDLDSPVLMFAGLYENWKQPDGEWLQTFSLITRAAIDPMSQLHDRTPLMLHSQSPELKGWLHGDAADAKAIADAAVPPRLVWHPVARAVSNPRSNGRALVDPVPLPPPPPAEPEGPGSASLFD
jgi:putative SOS response-associated peptidase YedK